MLKTVRRPGSGVDGGSSETGPTSEPDALALRLAGVGWGLFFIWVAALFIGGLPTSIGLTGIAMITLGIQATRKALGLETEGFWLVVGLGFLLAAVWEILNPGLPLTTALLLLVGVALLGSALRRRGYRGRARRIAKIDGGDLASACCRESLRRPPVTTRPEVPQ